MAFWRTRRRRSVTPPSEKEDLTDFPADFSELSRQLPKEEVEAPTGWPRYRRGGSPRNWTTPGSYRFTGGDGFVQTGVCEWSGAAASYGSLAVAFPARFAGKPLVFATPISTGGSAARPTLMCAEDDAGGFTLHWWTSAEVTTIKVGWIAFGPGSAL